jgi:hypothetical protein
VLANSRPTTVFNKKVQHLEASQTKLRYFKFAQNLLKTLKNLALIVHAEQVEIKSNLTRLLTFQIVAFRETSLKFIELAFNFLGVTSCFGHTRSHLFDSSD